MTLNKANIIDSVYNSIRFSRPESGKTFESLLEIIKKTLESGDDVLISGFGKFQVKQKAERRGRNPATGGSMPLAPRKVVIFKCSGKLRERINRRPEITEQTKNALMLFIEKADELQETGYLDDIQALNFRWSWDIKEGEKIEFEGPDSNQVRSVILTFRLFIQDRDGISFRALANNVLDDPGLSDDWKNDFQEIRQTFNDYLDEYPKIPTTQATGTIPTRRDIMQVFLYGDLAHGKDKRESFIRWNSLPLIPAFFKTEFMKILAVGCGGIITLRNKTKQELRIS